jgi:hypothetical protein
VLSLNSTEESGIFKGMGNKDLNDSEAEEIGLKKLVSLHQWQSIFRRLFVFATQNTTSLESRHLVTDDH